MWKRLILAVLAVVVVLAVSVYVKVQHVRAGMAQGAAFAVPTSVSTIVVQPQTWQPVLSAVGSLRAVHGVTVSTDLAGKVGEIAFESGTAVKAGDLLVHLDSQQEEAQLHSAEAKRDLAKADLDRKRELIARKTIAASDWDAAESELRQSDAAVEEAKALIARKQIRAPFDGVIGIRQVSLGQYVNPGSMIAPLQSLDPIYVEFSLPQQHLAAVSLGKKLRMTATGFEDRPFTGEITAIDSRVDDASRNIVVQGTIANPDHKLKPGMFVSVEVLLPQQEKVLAIPSSAINYAPYGDSVYVVTNGETNGPDGKLQKQVVQKVVKLGPTRGDQVTVLKGLTAGDEIVTAGVFRLHTGAPVRVNNSVQPGNDPNPKPTDT